jgi:hypothetical protein
MMRWIKKYFPYLGALFGILMIPYILITTPSLGDSHRKFKIMENDLQKMLTNKASIVAIKEVNKYGVASLSAEITGLMDARKLTALGWFPVNDSGSEYCKDGMLLTTYFSDTLFMGLKVLNVDFRYTTKTISFCNNYHTK